MIHQSYGKHSDLQKRIRLLCLFGLAVLFLFLQKNSVEAQNRAIVSLNANGGTIKVSDKVQSSSYNLVVTDENGKALLPDEDDVICEYKQFDGWYTEPEKGIRITSDTVIIQDTCLYAHWKQLDVEINLVAMKIDTGKSTSDYTEEMRFSKTSIEGTPYVELISQTRTKCSFQLPDNSIYDANQSIMGLKPIELEPLKEYYYVAVVQAAEGAFFSDETFATVNGRPAYITNGTGYPNRRRIIFQYDETDLSTGFPESVKVYSRKGYMNPTFYGKGVTMAEVQLTPEGKFPEIPAPVISSGSFLDWYIDGTEQKASQVVFNESYEVEARYKSAKTDIDSIEILDLTIPVAGRKPLFTGKVNSNSGYSITQQIWTDAVTGQTYSTKSTSCPTALKSFKENNVYYYTAIIKPDTKHVFSSYSQIQGSVNDSDAWTFFTYKSNGVTYGKVIIGYVPKARSIVTLTCDGGSIYNQEGFIVGEKQVVNTSYSKTLDGTDESGRLSDYCVKKDKTFFMGWCLKPQDFSTKVDDTTIFYKDTTLYAFLKKYPVIKLDANKGKILNDNDQLSYEARLCPSITRETIENGTVPLTDPFWYAATFDGWYTKAEGGEKVTENTVFLTDTTIYAHWKNEKNVISQIMINDITLPSTGQTPDLSFTIPNDAQYEIDEVVWYLDEDGNGEAEYCTNSDKYSNKKEFTVFELGKKYTICFRIKIVDSKSSIFSEEEIRALCNGTRTELTQRKGDFLFVYQSYTCEKSFYLRVIGGTGSGYYSKNGKAEIKATVPDGYHFQQWYVSTGKASLQDNFSSKTILKMNRTDVIVKAEFGEHVLVEKSDATGHWQECSICGYRKTQNQSVSDKGKEPSVVDEKSPIGAFVDRMYRYVLGREADNGGKQFWINGLRNGTETGASIASKYVFSEEFISRNYSDEQYLKVLYRAFFERDPEPEGMEYWLGQIRNGMSRTWVFCGFLQAEEYAKVCAYYDIPMGEYQCTEPRDQNPGLTAYVCRCYSCALNREFDTDGVNYWTDEIMNQRKDAKDVAKEFILSEEFSKKNLSDDAYIGVLYRTFFGREGESEGMLYWKKRLAQGNSREDILASFTESKEFNEIIKSFGI